MCWQRDTEWKQFSIISNEDLIKLDPSVQPQSVGLVISHSCDIANTNLQAEPTIEILIGIFNEKKCDGSFSNGKNNRTLHIQVNADSFVRLELKMTDKITIEKAKIASLDLHPSIIFNISDDNQKIIKRWLTTRYDRAAFPDTFNNLMGEHGINKKIKRFLEKNTTNEIIGLLLNYKEHIDPSWTQYELTILILYMTHDNPQLNKEIAQKVANEIKDIFAKTMPEESFLEKDCIFLKTVLPISDEALTYKQSQLFVRWEPGDDLSMEIGGESISV